MTDDELPRLYSLKEVSEHTGFALRTLERDCRAGRVVHVHRGRDRMMTAAHVAALIEKHTRQPEADLKTIAKAVAHAADRERLDRIMAREASRRTPRRA